MWLQILLIIVNDLNDQYETVTKDNVLVFRVGLSYNGFT